ncbi:MAG: phosphopentomutase [Clostridia bacterium]|nr:phosphopentomutase [Clostridia bacterium]
MKRIFLIVLDSFGIGYAADAEAFGDKGSNTLEAIKKSAYFKADNMASLGLFNIDKNGGGLNTVGAYGRLCELSCGKDTTIGHWEIAGIVSQNPLPTYPNGFDDKDLAEFSKRCGRRVLCNKPYSGTQVILDYGREHIETGALIVYTSADSVFQIAAHEDIVPIEKLYEYCEIAREIFPVGRVIARPFMGEHPNFTRTANRHDFSLAPPKKTMLDYLHNAGYDTPSVGKIYDIFDGQGVSSRNPTKSNADGMAKTLEYLDTDFNGLCFVNLVDFDSLWGHRNDVEGYAKGISEFDAWLPSFTEKMREDDLLIITADHGCDPSTPSTDHSREDVPLLIYGKGVKNVNLGTRKGFCDIAKTVCDIFGVDNDLEGDSFKELIL